MSLQQMEESAARPNENGEDMQQHPFGGAYRGIDKDSEDSDSDNDKMDEDQSEKKDMVGERMSEKTLAWVNYMKDFDERVKAIMADDLTRLFGAVSIREEESKPAAQVEKEQVAKDVSAGKEEESKSEGGLDEETAKRKKEQLEAELRKKLKEGTPQDLQLLQASLTTKGATSQGENQAGDFKGTNPV